MQAQQVTPQPGGTYIMRTGEPKTIIFEFINVGHYRVDGVDRFVPSHSDLALPWTINAGPFNHKKP